ncbi:TonB-dependent siderophore receptor [Enterovibrio calviensis]|uniref:TonB-dependent siderophore receptor n=1 Tax=Enterovibrio calviensis TaxID=91359 RepID=UPI0037359355
MNRQVKLSQVSIAVAFALATGIAQANQEEIMVVVGTHQESAVGPDFSYLGEQSKTATKTELPISETPRAISVVTREQMDDRASVSISDALQYTPSIQTNYFGEDNKQDWFVIRGFKQANSGLYQDGTRLYSSGFYSWQIDPFGLERVEVLRGPASVLYGQNPPGGVVNVVSKRPQFDAGSGKVAVEVGSYDRKQLSADVNTEISDDFAFRLVALGRKNSTRVDGVEGERFLLAPSLAWNINDQSNMTFLASYQKDDSDPYLQFLPMEGTLTDNQNGKISDELAVGNPDWETFEREQLTIGYEFEHQFNSNLQFAQSARYSQMDINLRQIYSLGYAADNASFGPLLDPTNERSTVLRAATTEEGESDAFNIDNRVIYTVSTGAVDHTLLFGLDYQSLDIKNKDYASDPLVADGNNLLFGSIPNPTFDVFTPSYSSNITLVDSTLTPLSESDRQTTKTKNRQLGLYFQDQLKINDQWVVQAGARYDDTRNETHNTSTNARTRVDNEEWTTNLGVAYITKAGFTPYVSFATSFDPIIQLDSNGDQLKPERGEQLEIGVKYLPSAFDGYVNVAAFEVTKENLTRTVAGQVTQLGEVENQGVEIEALANVTRSLTLLGNVSFIDSKVTADGNEALIGKTPSQLADVLASAWANYRFLNGPLDGLTIGSGVRYVGESYGDDLEQNTVPSYTLVDATVSYRIDEYKFQVAAKNMFDKEYIATCNYWCWYGDRRNVIASVSYDW